MNNIEISYQKHWFSVIFEKKAYKKVYTLNFSEKSKVPTPAALYSLSAIRMREVETDCVTVQFRWREGQPGLHPVSMAGAGLGPWDLRIWGYWIYCRLPGFDLHQHQPIIGLEWSHFVVWWNPLSKWKLDESCTYSRFLGINLPPWVPDIENIKRTPKSSHRIKNISYSGPVFSLKKSLYHNRKEWLFPVLSFCSFLFSPSTPALGYLVSTYSLAYDKARICPTTPEL